MFTRRSFLLMVLACFMIIALSIFINVLRMREKLVHSANSALSSYGLTAQECVSHLNDLVIGSHLKLVYQFNAAEGETYTVFDDYLIHQQGSEKRMMTPACTTVRINDLEHPSWTLLPPSCYRFRGSRGGEVDVGWPADPEECGMGKYGD